MQKIGVKRQNGCKKWGKKLCKKGRPVKDSIFSHSYNVNIFFPIVKNPALSYRVFLHTIS